MRSKWLSSKVEYFYIIYLTIITLTSEYFLNLDISILTESFLIFALKKWSWRQTEERSLVWLSAAIDKKRIKVDPIWSNSNFFFGTLQSILCKFHAIWGWSLLGKLCAPATSGVISPISQRSVHCQPPYRDKHPPLPPPN